MTEQVSDLSEEGAVASREFAILRSFSNAGSTSEVVQYRMRWENDYESTG